MLSEQLCRCNMENMPATNKRSVIVWTETGTRAACLPVLTTHDVTLFHGSQPFSITSRN